MHVGVIGAGQHGATLAEWCAESGHDVAVTSRHPERLGDVVDHLFGHGTALPIAETVTFADVVLFAPTWETAYQAIELAGTTLDGKIIIDATNPTGAAAGDTSGFEQLVSMAPTAHWAKALNTLPTSVLDRRRGHDPLLAEFVCSDHRDARLAASALIRDMGFAPFYAGGAQTARLTEPGGPLQQNEVDVFHAQDALAEALTTLR
ncbi:NAD(P)-binding domain-containing protein [Actinoplanes sp. LDG1-06]|uniref:NAD(P)-binding domain-containing protein n=1 Tax=Paractinoplanes ovalisporus TaxID=2810368 RepID=A0ABS2AMD3_9ACTN|nr:NAD(P)-binding domain-containing protein [Actinoplanes ovalisporus]MBM2621013.1 NAD(P)-binding domain-containing protein [Actinoplanes ovalisporus]